MNKYCNHINFKMFPLKQYDFDWTPRSKPTVSDVSVDQVNPELNKIMYDLGVYVSYIQVFYRPEHDYCSIHTDCNGGDFIKINWAYGGLGSKMTWYSIKPEKENTGTLFKTEVDSEFIVHNEADVILEHTDEIIEGTPAVIQVGIPHHIDNQLNQRYCISFSISDLKTHNRLTMQESISIFKDYYI